MLWSYSAARRHSYIISYFCTTLKYYIIQKVLVEKIKLDYYLLKVKPYLCIFIAFQVHLRWGMPWQGKGSSLGTTRV